MNDLRVDNIQKCWTFIINMNIEIENAIRSVARRCRQEIISRLSATPVFQHDEITTEILNRYARMIIALPPGTFSAKMWLSYYVRVIDREMNNAP